MNENQQRPIIINKFTISFFTISVVVWIVLMILHYVPGLCPAIAAVSAFWIWFPLWIVPAALFAFLVIFLLIGIICACIIASRE